MMQSAIRSFLAVALCAGLARAQAPTRTIQGSVRDQLGYVVAGAQVTLQGSGYEHAAASGADGSFRGEGAHHERRKQCGEAQGFARCLCELAADTDEVDGTLSLG